MRIKISRAALLGAVLTTAGGAQAADSGAADGSITLGELASAAATAKRTALRDLDVWFWNLTSDGLGASAFIVGCLVCVMLAAGCSDRRKQEAARAKYLREAEAKREAEALGCAARQEEWRRKQEASAALEREYAQRCRQEEGRPYLEKRAKREAVRARKAAGRQAHRPRVSLDKT